jgi:ABC-type lipoprotein release transport system permease subunit
MKLLPIIKLSWKNIWRNKTRSGVVIVAVILGTWAGVFMSAFMYGLSMQYIRSELVNFTSHIQIHTNDYNIEPLSEYYIPSSDSLIGELSGKPFITGIAARTKINGLASSSASSFGVTIRGIEPESEKQISELYTHMTEGDYFESRSRNQVLVGEKLAHRLNLKLRSKVVLNFQDVEGTISAAAFRVTGIFKSPNSVFDESNVFVRSADLGRLISAPGAVHEIAIMTKDFKQAEYYKSQIHLSEDLSIQSWIDLSPALAYTDSMVGTSLYIIMSIILVALTFGIINTMLMAVLERQQELGMLMAVGVNKVRTFFMILSETFFLAIFGAPFGVFLAWVGITLMEDTGINVGAFAEGFEMYGMGTVIYPELEPEYYLNIGILIFVVTLLASVYPSYKALKLNPVQAIRKI